MSYTSILQMELPYIIEVTYTHFAMNSGHFEILFKQFDFCTWDLFFSRVIHEIYVLTDRLNVINTPS